MRAITSGTTPFHRPGPLLGAVFALLLLAAGAAAIFFTAAQGAASWSRHTLGVGLQLDRAQILVMRAEIYRRGFVLTGDPLQEELQQNAARQVGPALDTLAHMTADNPRQGVNIARLRTLLDARLADMAAADRLRVQGRIADAIALTRSGQHAIVKAIAAQDVVRREEERLLTRREGRARSLGRLAELAFAASALSLLLLTSLVWRDRRSRLRALSQANRELAIDMALRQQAEAQLEMLAANATDAVISTTLDGACLYASPSAEDVLGTPPTWLIGRPLLALVTAADREAASASFARLVSGESMRELVTFRPRRIGAQQCWLEANSRLVRDPATGAPREVIASVRDVTPRKLLELELETARQRAEEASAAKAGFLANMSHEIRTPMNGVLGFTDLVLASELTPEQRRQMELIAESGRSMMRLLNDILDLSKIESGGMLIATEAVDLRHVLRRCMGLMAPVAEQKKLALAVAIDPALPARIAGDALRIRQILLNLLGNAVKFTTSGEVGVAVRVEGDRLRIAVRDTGIGIPADRLDHVFQQFVQAEDSTARRFGGSGLGLSISAQLARLMGGGIAVESREGQGSVFTLDLPLEAIEPAEAAAGAAEPVRPATPVSHATRVLIAEDHEINQELIGAMMRRVGAEPAIACDGAEAVAMVNAAAAAGEPFALVLMDMQMPVVDGIEATRRLRAQGHTPEALPILALTANAFADDVQACLDAGMQGHLTKPVQIDTLAAAVSRFARISAPATPSPAPVTVSPALIERYRMRKAATIAAVEALVTGEASVEAQEAAVDLLHKLAGTAGMFGEAAAGDHARTLEVQLRRWLSAGENARVREAVTALRRA